MTITQITVGKSIQVVEIGMPERWDKLTITADLHEDENHEAAIAELRQLVDEKLQQPTTTYPAQKPVVLVDEQTDKLFQETKKKIIAAKSKAAAGEILINSGFKLNVELKNLVNDKK